MVHEQDFLTACIDQKWCGLYTSSLGDFSDHLLRLDTAEFFQKSYCTFETLLITEFWSFYPF
jgi:hypothetical protein